MSGSPNIFRDMQQKFSRLYLIVDFLLCRIQHFNQSASHLTKHSPIVCQDGIILSVHLNTNVLTFTLCHQKQDNLESNQLKLDGRQFAGAGGGGRRDMKEDLLKDGLQLSSVMHTHTRVSTPLCKHTLRNTSTP